MFDEYPNALAETEMLVQRAMTTAIEQFLLALIIVIASVTALALLAVCVGMIGAALKGSRVAAPVVASPARAIARRPALADSHLSLIAQAQHTSITHS